MPPNENESFDGYTKLVLKELERLNDNYEKMKDNLDFRFREINSILSDFKSTERTVGEQKNWIDKVNEVWSVSQMKEAKNELYRQKNKWIATIAIITFLQILIGVGIAVWGKF